jgi:hypothetical protein
MAKEDIADEALQKMVAAEVDRRIGGMVGQIGKDLEDRYATKDLVTERIDARAQEEMAGFNRAILQAAAALRKDEKLPPNHPFAVLVQLMEEQLDLEMRVMELGLYIVADNVTLKNDKGTIERALKLSLLKKHMADREHRRILDMTGKVGRVGAEEMEMLDKFAEILGPPPKEDDDDET